MIILINIFGTFFVLTGIILIINPSIVFGLFNDTSDNILVYIGAIVARIILGSLLIYISSFSKYPLVMFIFGLYIIIQAIVSAVIGWNRFSRFLSWILLKTEPFAEPFCRAGGVMSVCFGVFIIYAIY